MKAQQLDGSASDYEPRNTKRWLRILPTNRENKENVTVDKILLLGFQQPLVKAVAQTSRKTAESRRSAISMVIVT